MSKVMVHQAENGKAAVANPFMAKVEDAWEAVQKRAFELFENRGGAPGGEMCDWLQAEQELFFVPQAELTETDAAFEHKDRRFRLQSFRYRSHRSAARNRGGGKAQKRDRNSLEEKTFYRRFELPGPVDATRVHASMDNGHLTIDAPKQDAPKQDAEKKPIQTIPVRAAAA